MAKPGSIIRYIRRGNQLRALIAGYHIGMEREIIIESPNAKDIGRQVSGFFGRGEYAGNQIAAMARQRKRTKPKVSYSFRGGELIKIDRRTTPTPNRIVTRPSKKGGITDSRITDQFTPQFRSSGRTKRSDSQVFGPPTPTAAQRAQADKRADKRFDASVLVPPPVRDIVRGVKKGVESVQQFKDRKELIRQRNMEAQQAQIFANIAAVESARTTPKIGLLEGKIEEYNLRASEPVYTEEAFNLLEAERKELVKQSSQLSMDIKLQQEAVGYAEKHIGKIDALNIKEATLFGGIAGRKDILGAFEAGFATETSKKAIPQAEGTKFEKTLEIAFGQNVKAVEAGIKFGTLPFDLALGKEKAGKIRDSISNKMFDTTFSAAPGAKVKLPNPLNPEFQVGSIIGAIEGVREKPLKTAVITGASFGAGFGMQGLASSTKVASFVGTRPALEAALAGGGQAAKVTLPTIFAGTTALRVAGEEPGRKQGEALGEIFSTELLPAVGGFAAGDAVGRQIFGTRPMLVKGRSVQRENLRFDDQDRSFFEVKGQQRARYLGSEKEQIFNLKGGTEVRKIDPLDVTITGKSTKSGGRIIDIRGAQFEISGKDVARFDKLLSGGQQFSISDTRLAVRGGKSEPIGFIQSRSLQGSFPKDGQTIMIKGFGQQKSINLQKQIFTDYSRDVSAELFRINNVQQFGSVGTSSKDIIGTSTFVKGLTPLEKPIVINPQSVTGVGLTMPRVTIINSKMGVLPVSPTEITQGLSPFIVRSDMKTFGLGFGAAVGAALVDKSQSKSLNKQFQIQLPKPMSKVDSPHKTMFSPKMKQEDLSLPSDKFEYRYKDLQIQLPEQGELQLPDFEEIIINPNPPPPIFRPTPPPPPPPPPMPFGLFPPGGGDHAFSYKPRRRAKQIKRYVPSLVATEFDLFGPAPKKGKKFTGLEIRTKVKKKKKKKAKGKKKQTTKNPFDYRMKKGSIFGRLW